MIKKLHYVWLGGGVKPASVRSCIKTWKRNCPDWEITEWNETNFDVGKYTWVREAIAHKKYAFAADFIRLYVLFHYGGAYLDTDVDILKPVESILAHGFVCGVQIPTVVSDKAIYNRISLQTGFLYSGKGHPLPQIALRELYDDGNRHFVRPDGSLEMMPVDIRLMDVLMDFFCAKPADEDQCLKDDVVLYNSRVFATRKTKDRSSFIVHWFDQSWTDSNGLVSKMKKYIKKNLYFIYRKQ